MKLKDFKRAQEILRLKVRAGRAMLDFMNAEHGFRGRDHSEEIPRLETEVEETDALYQLGIMALDLAKKAKVDLSKSEGDA